MARLSDLFSYAATHCRFDRTAYFDPRYPDAESVRLYRNDKARRDRNRANVLKRFAGRVRSNEELKPGRYFGTRLSVSPAGEIDYIPGQFAAVEIWPAIEAYLVATN